MTPFWPFTFRTVTLPQPDLSVRPIRPDQQTPSDAVILIRSGEQRAAVWLDRGISSPEPQADFAKEMIIMVYEDPNGRDAVILSVQKEQGRIVVRYRYRPTVEKTPESAVSYYRVIPRSDRPVTFEQVP